MVNVDELKSKAKEFGIDSKVFEDNESGINDYLSLIANYQSLSKQELLAEFIRVTKKSKEDGNLDPKKLSEIAKTIAPFLDDNQKTILATLLRYL